MKRKQVIVCPSEDAMNRKADALMEQGFQVEREFAVLPIPTIFFPVYRITYWK